MSGETSEAIAQARGTISKTESEILSLSRQMSGRLEQVATLLEQINAITSRVDKGQGTAGALINDPRLYESLVDTTRELNATIKDLKRLFQQWEQEGVQLKLR
jgi:ABC-type transporter Mla subunit MlaD